MRRRNSLWNQTVPCDPESALVRRVNFLLGATTIAKGKTVPILDKAGLALQGYDPVALFIEGKPAEGALQFQSTYRRAIYLNRQ